MAHKPEPEPEPRPAGRPGSPDLSAAATSDDRGSRPSDAPASSSSVPGGPGGSGRTGASSTTRLSRPGAYSVSVASPTVLSRGVAPSPLPAPSHEGDDDGRTMTMGDRGNLPVASEVHVVVDAPVASHVHVVAPGAAERVGCGTYLRDGRIRAAVAVAATAVAALAVGLGVSQSSDRGGQGQASSASAPPAAAAPNVWGCNSTKIIPDDSADGDRFGWDVAMDGTTALIGAYTDETDGIESGSAYVYRHNGVAGWELEAKFLPNDNRTKKDYFGRSVAIHQDTAVIGCRYDDDEAAGKENTGSAYVFVRNAGTGDWAQQAKLALDKGDRSEEDRFGYSVAVHEDTVIIGLSTGKDIDGKEGKAFVFTRTTEGQVNTRPASNWVLQATLAQAQGPAHTSFAFSLALHEDTVMVSSPWEDVDGHADSGAVYVFTRSAGDSEEWTQQARLFPTDVGAGHHFGESLALYGDTAIIGAPFHGINGESSGAAYVFTRTGNAWTQEAMLVPGDGEAADNFGISVAFDGDTLVLGARGDGISRGAAYVFVRSEEWGQWRERGKIIPEGVLDRDHFGTSVAIGGDQIVIGSYGDDSRGDKSGAAYAVDQCIVDAY